MKTMSEAFRTNPYPMWLSAIALALGIGPSGLRFLWTFKLAEYDPTIAVLTATLIALIWTANYAYLAVKRSEFEFERTGERQRIRRVADEYVSMARRRADAGPHALATLGLEQLGGDSQIRDALREMVLRAGAGEDPWAGQARDVEDIDLMAFFRYVRENHVDLFKQSVAEVAAAVRKQSGARRV